MPIKYFEKSDWSELWAAIKPVFRAGETYAYSPQITEEEAFQIWVEKPEATFVATGPNGEVVGTYYVKKNQPGLGSHVCNCGYIVSESGRGKGIATAMCRHSQIEGIRRGFKGMQFNLVVTSNQGAIRLWQKMGFEIVGTIPEAFSHSKLGCIDAHVMYKKLARSLNSERLTLRRFNNDDAGSVKTLLSDPQVMKFTGFRKPQSQEKIDELLRKWIEGIESDFGVWAVDDFSTKKFIGWAMLKSTDRDSPELGYMLEREHWGKGYATEITKLLLDYGFSFPEVNKITAATDTQNRPSIRVLEKAGMKKSTTICSEGHEGFVFEAFHVVK